MGKNDDENNEPEVLILADLADRVYYVVNNNIIYV